MGRQKKESYASDAELAWFQPENYSDLLGHARPESESQEERAACYRQWATLVWDRVQLKQLWETGELTEYVQTHFERIKRAPLEPIGFGKTNVGATHIANSATVKAMTSNRVKWLRHALIRAQATDQSIVDVVLAKDPESSFGEYAHLTINITATNEQLIDDFKRWLGAWRSATQQSMPGDFRSKIANWTGANILQYHDLTLFSKIAGRSVSVEQRFRLMQTTDQRMKSTLQVTDTRPLRRLSGLESEVFSIEMAKRLAHLAERDELAVAQRDPLEK